MLRMLDLSVVFVCSWPFCFRGAEPFESILELFSSEYRFLVAREFTWGSVAV